MEYADIQIDLGSIKDENVRLFVDAEVHKMLRADIAVHLVNSKYVRMGSLKVNGYFSDETCEMAVAAKRPLDQWLTTFVHESCHFDQWNDNARIWGQTVRGADPIHMLDLWINEVIELKPIPLYQMMYAALKVELDCEKRAAQKIKKHKLPFNVAEYIQRANSYVYFYHMLAQRREWYHIGLEPYNIPEVWQAMPKTYDNDYTKLPTEYKKLYVEHCFKGVKR